MVPSFSKAFRAQERIHQVRRQGQGDHTGDDVFHNAPLKSVAAANEQQAHGKEQKHYQNEHEVKHG
jgi:hypothetical protein